MGVASLTGRPAVFLDRDGVLVRAFPDADGVIRLPPASLADFEILPGAKQACELLRISGYELVIVTNQPDVPRGKQKREVADEMNRLAAVALGIADVRVCYHDDGDGCACRKPKPGMLVDAARDRALDLKKSFIVGDNWRDIEAGRRAGVTTVFVGSASAPDPDLRADDVLDAARKIASWRRSPALE